MIIPYFHFAGGDHLLFKAWQPTSAGAIVGACLGVFFLAIFERLVYAFSHVLVHYLMRRYNYNISTPNCPQTNNLLQAISESKFPGYKSYFKIP